MHDNDPVLRFEMVSMRESVLKLMTSEKEATSQLVKEAFDKFFEPDNLRRVVDAQVAAIATQVLNESVRNFFAYGPGKDAVNKIVQQRVEVLLKEQTHSD